jgi:hypothetical protein
MDDVKHSISMAIYYYMLISQFDIVVIFLNQDHALFYMCTEHTIQLKFNFVVLQWFSQYKFRSKNSCLLNSLYRMCATDAIQMFCMWFRCASSCSHNCCHHFCISVQHSLFYFNSKDFYYCHHEYYYLLPLSQVARWIKLLTYGHHCGVRFPAGEMIFVFFTTAPSLH